MAEGGGDEFGYKDQDLDKDIDDDDWNPRLSSLLRFHPPITVGSNTKCKL